MQQGRRKRSSRRGRREAAMERRKRNSGDLRKKSNMVGERDATGRRNRSRRGGEEKQ